VLPDADPKTGASATPAGAPKRAPAKRGPSKQVLELQQQLLAEKSATASAFRRADELATVARKQTEMADELHAENARLREGEIREATAPIIRGLSRLADDMAKLRLAAGEPGAELGLADLKHLEQRVLELLHDAGVTPLTPAAGDAFDVRLHEAAGTIETEDPLQDRTIVAVRRPGLIRDDGRVMRPAAVLVHRFELTSGDRP
jgi:molecular chaperone GrpE (heat shock protein)